MARWRCALALLALLAVLVGVGCSPTTKTVEAGDEGADASTTTVSTQVAEGSDISRFAGAWHRHGITVEVSEAGDIEATYRVYAWCDDTPEPCDSMDEDGTIHNGGHLLGHLESFTARSAKVTVESDTADVVGHLGPSIFELLDDGKARLADIVMCSDTTEFDAECGA